MPVLIVCASKDALFEVDGCMRQYEHDSGTMDVSTVVIDGDGAGHALTLELTRKEFQAEVSAWLSARGF